MNKPWTESDDKFLIAYGPCIGVPGSDDGYAFIARHDLGFTEQEGRDRIVWLRANNPDLIEKIEAIERWVDRNIVP